MKRFGMTLFLPLLAGMLLPCPALPQTAADRQALPQSAPPHAGEPKAPAPPQRNSQRRAASGSAPPLTKPAGKAAERAVPAGPGKALAEEGPARPAADERLDELEEELGKILDESVQEALEAQRKAFERDYSRLWDSRSFWRRAAIGEGGAIVTCLLGGFLIWNLTR